MFHSDARADMTSMKFSVFGHKVLVTRSDAEWAAFYLGDEGKRAE